MGDEDLPEGERFEILVRLHDTMQASMLRDLLEEEGIPVATPGLNHRAAMGAVFAHIEVVVQVPRADYAKAAELMTAFTGFKPVHDFEPSGEDTEGAGPYRAAAGFAEEEEEEEVEEEEELEEEEEPLPPSGPRRGSTLGERKLSVLVGAALFLPGGGHIYVQRYAGALVIFLLTLLVLYFALAIDSSLFLGWPLLVALDVYFARQTASQINARLGEQAERQDRVRVEVEEDAEDAEEDEEEELPAEPPPKKKRKKKRRR